MPTRRTRETVDTGDPGEPAGLPIATTNGAALAQLGSDLEDLDELESEESGVDRVLTLLRGNPDDRARIKLYRRAQGRESWCADMTVGDFEAGGFQYIRANWGPGSYVLMVYGPHPRSGKVARLAREEFSIEPESITGNAAAARPSGLEAVIERMAQQQAEFQAAMLQALSTRPDPMAQMRDTLALVGAMREAFGLGGGGTSTRGALTEAIEAVRLLRDVSGEMNPGREEPKSDLERMVEMATPVLGMIAQRMGQPAPLPALQVPAHLAQGGPQAPAVPGQQLPAAPAPAAVPAAVELTPELLATLPDAQRTVMVELLKALDELLAIAQRGGSVDEGADYIAEKLPDELVEFLNRPDWFEMLAGFVPKVRPFEQWMRDAVALVDFEDAPEDGPAQAPAAPGAQA